ncbi:MAG: hypothetical protein C3F13_04275 [Anaerolineales bacterium]|nr:MAG: hypothetical protein C3F13_04275 [Anaerolineales bacterium]
MDANQTLLVVDRDCAEAVGWLTNKMSLAGLAVVRTFDLQATRHVKAACPCHEDGTEKCDCQMVVLFVYQASCPPGCQPLSLVAHGYHGQTWFSLVDNPAQRPDPALEKTIRRLFSIHFQNVT